MFMGRPASSGSDGGALDRPLRPLHCGWSSFLGSRAPPPPMLSLESRWWFLPSAVRSSRLGTGAPLEDGFRGWLAVPIQPLTAHVVAVPPDGYQGKHETPEGLLSGILSYPASVATAALSEAENS